MASLQLKNLVKVYGKLRVVHGINLTIEDEEFVVFVGPSGCGKSTTLRMVAGLEHISGGEVLIGDKVVNRLEPGRRDISMVFQNYALYPHMSVAENLAFCLQQRRTPKREIGPKVREAAETLRITDLLDRRPSQLSGGQRQRVAMGRAIVRNPSVFLFDEPLSNLDAKLRVEMRAEIKRLHRLIPTTTVYVTHDQTEAMTMADRVVVMNAGHIEQVGTPLELYDRPQTTFVAGFIGSPPMNLVPAEVTQENGTARLAFPGGVFLPLPAATGLRSGKTADHRKVIFGIRPEAVSTTPRGGDSHPIDLVVEEVEPLGIETIVFARLGDTPFCARIPPGAIPKIGETLTLNVDLSRAVFFDPDTRRVID